MSATWSDAPMPPASDLAELVDRLSAEARGHLWSFRVVHGDLETSQDADALEQLGVVARQSGALVVVEGRNDETFWCFEGAGGREACRALFDTALTVGAPWWRVHLRFAEVGQ